ncbi:MAG: superoxide dismutase [Bacteroidetes bacterium]|nr:superoxide dismutase [Bacteroidota bacterium]
MSRVVKSRRKFITDSAKTAIAVTVGLSAAGSIIPSEAKATSMPAGLLFTNFDQQPLPYKYDALENVIDAMTMEIHYSKHAAAYAKNLKEAATAEKVDMSKPLENVLMSISKFSGKMRNNGGGHYNHEMFWQSMRPKMNDNKPGGTLAAAIDKTFGSFTDFKKQFGDAGKNRFGSGWAWLYADAGKALKIGSTPNQDNPLMDICDIKGTPLLGLDVWEHAYYLKYQNKRADYIENWWNVVNWDFVQQRFEKL